MKVKNKPKLLKELANSVNDPWEFLEAVAALENLSMSQAAKKAGLSKAQYYVSKQQKSMGVKVALKFSNAFGINPVILNRIVADFNLKKILEKETEEN